MTEEELQKYLGEDFGLIRCSETLMLGEMLAEARKKILELEGQATGRVEERERIAIELQLLEEERHSLNDVMKKATPTEREEARDQVLDLSDRIKSLVRRRRELE